MTAQMIYHHSQSVDLARKSSWLSELQLTFQKRQLVLHVVFGCARVLKHSGYFYAIL